MKTPGYIAYRKSVHEKVTAYLFNPPFISITGPNNRIIDNIKTIWQKDADSSTFRLVTIIPPKK